MSELSRWIGRSETVDDTVTATPYAALSATLDRPSEVGSDGHAKRGGFLPPVPLPRRMWAGSQFEFKAPLGVGDRIRRVSTIADVTEKSGRTGPLDYLSRIPYLLNMRTASLSTGPLNFGRSWRIQTADQRIRSSFFQDPARHRSGGRG